MTLGSAKKESINQNEKKNAERCYAVKQMVKKTRKGSGISKDLMEKKKNQREDDSDEEQGRIHGYPSRV